MTLLVGRGAPNFSGIASMPDGSVSAEFQLSEYIKGRMAVIFFYSMDFSYVCATELVSLNNHYEEFAKHNIAVVCISRDSQLSHQKWRNTLPKYGGVGPLKFPLIADVNHKIAAGYDVLVNDSLSLRATFLIDKIGVIRHQSVNDFPIGRNVHEILRLIDAQLFHQETGKLCPINWQSGDHGLIADDESLASFMDKYADTL